MAESALLDQEPPPPPINNIDEIPIGGGNKFNLSEYPSENDTPAPRKPAARKPNKAKK